MPSRYAEIRARVEAHLDMVMTLAVLIVCGLLGVRMYRERPNGISEPVRRVTNWSELILGRTPDIGASRARVAVIEFSDYTCPFCRAMEPGLEQFVSRHRSDVALYRFDFPLEATHPMARISATAARCFAKQSKPEVFEHLLFQQKEITSPALVKLARISGIPSHTLFRDCLTSVDVTRDIDKDIETGRRLNIRATPTLIINGPSTLNSLFSSFGSTMTFAK